MRRIARCILYIAISCVAISSYGQENDTLKETTLPSIIIKAFEQNKKLTDVPASIDFISKSTLSHFNPVSIVSAINSMPGVKMEERSPGSYRLNIRGSSLRSPFGVRNVKIYYNEIPYTDPGGNSYLNQLGFYNINSIEILKGANNSIYGAGNGGVLLIESLGTNEKNNLYGSYTTGSFGLQDITVSLTTTKNSMASKLGVQHLESNGYREHSKLKKDIYSWNGSFKVHDKQLLKTTFLFGDLYYQTPGALTLTEYENNPSSARPSSGTVPGAISANTSIHQQMFLAGTTYEQPLIKNLTNRTTLYGMFAEMINPSIASYGKNSEPSFGGRTLFNFRKEIPNGSLSADLGFEYQRGFNTVTIYKNANGNADTLRNTDDINDRQHFLFAQGGLDISTWSFTAGLSLNKSAIHFERSAPRSPGKLSRSFDNQIAPRIAIMKKLHIGNLYASFSRGFSPPTVAELVPSGGDINLGLNPEMGYNYEAGIKSSYFKNFFIDLSTFTFSLQNTIVQRRTAAGSDYYINAGSTRQYGAELYTSYNPFAYSRTLPNSQIAISYTVYDFRYRDFRQGNNDYSGNKLPSVSPNTINASVNIIVSSGFFANLNYYYSDKIAQNDANTAFAQSYTLLGAKTGVAKTFGILKTRISIGADNLLNQHYSLGNDINAFGGRYYNAAPTRNFYLSFEVTVLNKHQL